VGNDRITSANVPAFMQSVKVIFLTFSLLCFAGIFASLARGRRNR